MKKLSFIIPAKDEEESIATLVDRIVSVVDSCSELSLNEIVLVDDGSVDDTWSVMTKLSHKFEFVKAIRFRRNFGKAIALEAGFKCATGDFVFTMDADLQDDPEEIPCFMEELDKGYDLVSGWKQRRYDPMSKTLPSKLFNWVTAKISGIALHDFNCGYKVYKREVVENLRLYGELHRYVPVLANDAGFKVGEIVVKHHARKFGESKYGFERYVRGFLDLITVLATTRYLQKPAHLFGGAGFAFGIIGFLILSYLTVIWLLGMGPIGSRPLFFLGIMLTILSIQMISIGVVAELIIKTTRQRELYTIVEDVSGDKNKLITSKLRDW